MNAVLQFVRLVTAIALLANVALAASANPPASEAFKRSFCQQRVQGQFAVVDRSKW